MWYVQDEVGSAIRHSDKPNVQVRSFVFSPTNSADDTISFNVIWPISDIKTNDGIYRDFLTGFDESKFRSARLHSWFYTPDDYYTKALDEFNKQSVDYAVESEFSRIQENHALKGTVDVDKLKVYTDDQRIVDTVSDERFEFVENPESADVCWAMGLQRTQLIQQAKSKGSYIN